MVLLPPVRWATRPLRDILGTAAFAAGAVLGGVTIALGAYVVAGTTGAAALPVRVAVFIGVLGVCLLTEAGRLPRVLVGRQDLIPQTRFRRSLHRGMFVFGYELGLGVKTRIPRMSPFVLLAILLATDVRFAGFLALAAGWGAGRAAPFVVRMAQQQVVGDLNTDQATISRVVERFDAVMETSGARATYLLFGGAAAVALGGVLRAAT